MKTFLILGAGTGGTMMANKLAKRLDPSEWEILMMKLTEKDLVDGAKVLGAMEFIDMSDGGQILFV